MQHLIRGDRLLQLNTRYCKNVATVTLKRALGKDLNGREEDVPDRILVPKQLWFHERLLIIAFYTNGRHLLYTIMIFQNK